MELDEVKRKTHGMKAPEVGVSGAPSLDGLIARLREQDTKDRMHARRMILLLSVAAVFTTLLFTLTWIFPPDTSVASSRFVLGLFALIFLSARSRLALKVREISHVDYAQPAGSFLQDAEKRYRAGNMHDLWFFLPYFILCLLTSSVAWMNAFQRYFPSLDPSLGWITYGVLWAIVTGVGAVLGVREWKTRRAPILKEIRDLRFELTVEEEQ